MTFLLKSWGKLCLLAIAMLLLAPSVLQQTWIRGDGQEYILMTHAVYQHGSPLIRSSDIADIKALPQEQLAQSQIPVDFYGLIEKHFETYQPRPYGSFAGTAPERFYAIHFWLYSALAAPFYALTTALGWNPAWAFALLNLAFAAGVYGYLHRSMPQHAYVGFVLFVILGGTYYMSWTGPEVMAASCALIATIAMLRAELGFSVLLAGLGATQNPSLIFMIPFACGYRALLWKWPKLSWQDRPVPRVGRREFVLMALGIALALLPYLFFQSVFGMPSLISKYFNHPQLITWNRFYSLWFDLDQGMLIGVPGLFAALVAAPMLLGGAARRRWLLLLAGVLAMVVCMALPTLSGINWNSGCIVMLRYAYWLAMPLLAVVLLGMERMGKGATIGLAFLAFALQGVAFAEYGVQGEASSPVAHTALARWVYRHDAAAYNPDPQIFYERGIGMNKKMPPTLTYLYRQDGVDIKFLRQSANQAPTDEYCPAGQRLIGQDVRLLDAGWQYEHPPFRCQ